MQRIRNGQSRGRSSSASRPLRIEPLEPRLILAADLAAVWQAENLNLSHGQVVSDWSDAIAGLVARAAGQPRFGDGSLGGRDAIHFDAADGTDSFRVDQRISPLSGADDFSIVVVFATSANDLQGNTGPWFQDTALIDASSLGFAFDWGMSINRAGQIAVGMGAGLGQPPVTLYSHASGLYDGQPHVVSAIRQGTRLSLRVDEQDAVERLDASGIPRSREIDTTFGMGVDGDRAFTGDIGQIRLYRGALSTDEADQAHRELTAFYVNEVPVTNNDHYALSEDTELSISAVNGVLANDNREQFPSLRANLVDGPQHGSLAFNDDGAFRYTPRANYFGVDTFTYRAADVLESEVTTVTMDVRAVYDPAVAVADTYRVAPNRLLAFSAAEGLLANDNNLDRATLTAELVGDPPRGELSLSTDAAREVIKRSLWALPSMSIVLPIPDLFDANRGIYANPSGRDERWERPASVEYILPDGSPGFHINAGLRIIGFTSRDLTVTPKLGFRVLFKSQYGQGQLDYPMFGDSTVTSFDTLMLRGNARDTWVTSSLPAGPRGQALFIRDQWAKMAQAAMGQPASNGRFVHLYLNGIKWGIYNPTERPDAAFAAEHFGGDPSDYDVVRFCCPHEVVDGDMDEWCELLARSTAGLADNDSYQRIQGNRPDGTRDPNLPVLIDIDSFIDFVLHGQYHASVDWPGNYYVIRERGPDSKGFKFLTWDNDLAFPNLSVNSNKVRTDPGHPWWTTSPGVMDIALRRNPEYVIRFADRAHRHLFHDGPLTPEATARLWTQIADGMEEAMIAESARWGDYRRDVTPSGERVLYTVERHWRPTVDRMLENYFPRRTEIVLGQLRSAGLYPRTATAEFLVNGTAQYGGLVATGASFSIAAASGTIYYTLDGTDPRLPGGAVSPAAATYVSPWMVNTNLTVKARVLNGQEWSALSEATFVIHDVPTGDFDGDRMISVSDVDLLCAQIRLGNREARFDLTNDARVDNDDLNHLIRNILRTEFGDANLDRVFDSRDLVQIFQAGEYDDELRGNSTWSEGDWDCDGEFESSDLVRAFQSGAYVAASTAMRTLNKSPATVAMTANDRG